MTYEEPIDEAAELLDLFIQAYRNLEPLVHVSDETAVAIDEVVADLVAGHKVDWIQGHPQPLFSPVTGDAVCCEHFLGFLERLHEHMVGPQVFSASHQRALMLLYAYDWELDFTQPYLSLEIDDKGRYWLESQPQFVEEFGQRARVRIEVETNSEDPTVFDRGWLDPRADYLNS